MSGNVIACEEADAPPFTLLSSNLTCLALTSPSSLTLPFTFASSHPAPPFPSLPLPFPAFFSLSLPYPPLIFLALPLPVLPSPYLPCPPFTSLFIYLTLLSPLPRLSLPSVTPPPSPLPLLFHNHLPSLLSLRSGSVCRQ